MDNLLIYWFALGVACIAVGICLMGVGYLMGLRVATRHAAGLVASVREEIVQKQAEREPGVVHENAHRTPAPETRRVAGVARTAMAEDESL